MFSNKLLSCVLLIFCVHAAIAWLQNRPQRVGADVPAGKLRSLSFAPYREGFSPILHRYPLQQHIEADVELVADKTQAIRTYSVQGGMQPTPAFARKYGLEMILGGWLGNHMLSNNNEVATLIKTANANPDVVKRVLVGSETLLRRDIDVDQLIGYIRQVKQAVNQPVSYADVWSIYLRYPQLMREVDFITIHILPYWEDEPVAVEQAIAHVEKIIQQVERQARELGIDKPILIGESGWPAAGRQRGYAEPGVVNATRYIRGLIEIANRHGLDYNIVEAFNQPWKSQHEGVVGANWGLLSADRKPVFPLTGPVQEHPNWSTLLALATALWLLLTADYFRKLEGVSEARIVVFLAFAQILAVCLVSMADYLWFTSYSFGQRAYTLAMLTVNTGLGVCLLQRSFAILTNQSAKPILARRLRNAYLFFTVLAAYKTYSLAFFGRYMSFPVEEFAIPALGVCGLIVCLRTNETSWNRDILKFNRLVGDAPRLCWDRVPAYLLSLGVVALVLGETLGFMSAYDFVQAHPTFSEGLPVALSYTLKNGQLLNWVLCILVLSIPYWSNPGCKTDHWWV